MTVNSSALQAVEWCNPSTSCYGFCRSIAIIASGDGRQRSKVKGVCVCVLVFCWIAVLNPTQNSRTLDTDSLKTATLAHVCGGMAECSAKLVLHDVYVVDVDVCVCGGGGDNSLTCNNLP